MGLLHQWTARIVGGRRLPVAAGLYYEADPELLRGQVEWCFSHPKGPGGLRRESTAEPPPVAGLLVPHAGLYYSGPIAAHGYAAVAPWLGSFDTVVVVAPNHTGLGAPVSVYPEGSWSTPLGGLVVDGEMARLVSSLGGGSLDVKAHLFEHSIEVQLPFIEYLTGKGSRPRLLAVAMYDQSPEAAARLGEAVAEAARRLGRRILFIATSNLSLYEPPGAAREKDKTTIEILLSMDSSRLYGALASGEAGMCGPGPAAALLHYLSRAGKECGGRLLGYATSGEMGGGNRAVVGYASLLYTCSRSRSAESGGAAGGEEA